MPGDQQGARGRTMLWRTDAFPSNFLQVAARRGGQFFYGDIDGRKVVGLNQHVCATSPVCDSFDLGRDRTGLRLSNSARFDHTAPSSRVKNRLLDVPIDIPLSPLSPRICATFPALLSLAHAALDRRARSSITLN